MSGPDTYIQRRQQLKRFVCREVDFAQLNTSTDKHANSAMVSDAMLPSYVLSGIAVDCFANKGWFGCVQMILCMCFQRFYVYWQNNMLFAMSLVSSQWARSQIRLAFR